MYKQILDYWFGDLDPVTGKTTTDKFGIWFGKSEETDQYLTDNYKELLESAKRGELSDWQNDSDSMIALIILLDQFSRNIYRDTPEMYSADDLAVELARKSLEFDLPTAYRVFSYMPFMHSEDLDDQNLCVDLFTQLVESVHEQAKESVQGNLKYAIEHRDIVEKYGRFPHRNKILGRQSTPEELEYLAQPGAGF